MLSVARVVVLVACALGCGGEEVGGTDDARASDAARIDAASSDGGVAIDGGRHDASVGDAAALDADHDAGDPIDGGARADAAMSACALAVPFDVGASYSRTLYVATTGAPGNDGSSASPFDTIESAARRAAPGDRIIVRAGTYRGGQYIEDLHGEPGRPIAIVGEGEVILDANGEGEVVHLSEVSWLVLEHLTFTGGTSNGLNIDDGGTFDTPSHHLVLRDLEVRDVGSGGNNDCIKLSGIDDYFIVSSTISTCRAGDMIDHVGCHRGYIFGNRFAGTPGSGGIQMKGGSSDILVHGNTFTDVSGRAINAGGSTGLQFFRPIDAAYEAARLVIGANVFVDSGTDSIVAFAGCDACVFANNTIVSPRGWIARVLQESTDPRFVPSRRGRFVNNIIVLDTTVARANEYNVGNGTEPASFTFGPNLWLATNDPSFPGPNADGPGIAESPGSIVGADPGLDVTEWTLCAAAPGADDGVPVPEVPADHAGACYAATRSMGADQADPCP